MTHESSIADVTFCLSLRLRNCCFLEGENVADMGGVKNSFYAYLNLSGATTTTKTLPVCKPASSDPTSCLTDRQLYFVAFAQGWCAKETANQERILQATDPHSPPQFRVQGPLQNFPTFAQTFECPVGSTYNPTSRCEVKFTETPQIHHPRRRQQTK